MGNEPVEWSDELHLGVDFLDDDHKTLIELVGVWCEAVSSNRPWEVSERLFQELIDFARQHFQTEEADMDCHRYHGSAVHRHEHQTLIARLDETFLHMRATAQYDLSVEFIDIVRDWAAGHIVTLDRQYAEFLKGQTPSS